MTDRFPALGAMETNALRSLVFANSGSHRAVGSLGHPSIDWPLLLASARRHRLGPLVLEGARICGAPIPAPVLDGLENESNLERAKAVVRLHYLDELAEAARRHGIDLFLLKGAAFATRLYSHPALRPMADVDVLVRRGEMGTWSRELQALGYALIDVSDHASAFRHGESGIVVELHRHLTSCASFLGLETEALLARSVATRNVEAWGVRTLSWEDHLLHLCLHASFQHGFRQAAINAWDANRIAELPAFDVSRFLFAARCPRLAPWIFGGIAMSEAVFPSARLTLIREVLADGLPARLQRKAGAFRPEKLLSPDPESAFGAPFGRLSWTSDTRTTLSLLLSISCPGSTDDRGRALPYLLRAWKLARNHGMGALRSAWRRLKMLVSPTPASLGEVRDV